MPNLLENLHRNLTAAKKRSLQPATNIFVNIVIQDKKPSMWEVIFIDIIKAIIWIVKNVIWLFIKHYILQLIGG